MNRKQENLQDKINEEMLIEAFSLKVKSQKELQTLKNLYSLKYKISSPSNVALIRSFRNLLKKGKIRDDKFFFNIIKKRKIRSQSGIANITVITKHYKCPGNCIYCPSEPNMPKSYLANEPAMMRAVLNDFDAFNQVKNRLSGLERTGHNTDKIEIIVAGGTFSYYPKNYQTTFVRDVYNALNQKKSK